MKVIISSGRKHQRQSSAENENNGAHGAKINESINDAMKKRRSVCAVVGIENQI